MLIKSNTAGSSRKRIKNRKDSPTCSVSSDPSRTGGVTSCSVTLTPSFDTLAAHSSRSHHTAIFRRLLTMKQSVFDQRGICLQIVGGFTKPASDCRSFVRLHRAVSLLAPRWSTMSRRPFTAAQTHRGSVPAHLSPPQRRGGLRTQPGRGDIEAAPICAPRQGNRSRCQSKVMGSDTFTGPKSSSHLALQDSLVWLSGVGGMP